MALKALLFFSAGFYAPAFENIYWLNSLLLTEMVMYQQDSEKEIWGFFVICKNPTVLLKDAQHGWFSAYLCL